MFAKQRPGEVVLCDDNHLYVCFLAKSWNAVARRIDKPVEGYVLEDGGEASGYCEDGGEKEGRLVMDRPIRGGAVRQIHDGKESVKMCCITGGDIVEFQFRALHLANKVDVTH
jgi:hypothetical protein